MVRNHSNHGILIVGNYCHDVLIRNGTVLAETLGGAASFISNVLNGLSISCSLIAKVGHDFKYETSYRPIIVPTSKTTVFHAYFDSISAPSGHSDRVLKRVCSCEPITPSDLPDGKFDYGMAVGVGGEILPETLEKMLEICNVVLVDIQSVIRVFDSVDGTVNPVPLKESGFYHLLPKIGFLKASSEEALFMDVEEVRKLCCVVVTNGREGSEVYYRDGKVKVSPFLANQIDPTGAGDSFLGGLVTGLVQELAVPDAALLGNFFGSITVAQIGLPKFDSRVLQRVKDEVQRRKLSCSERRDEEIEFTKPEGHEQFHSSLCAAKLVSACAMQECLKDFPGITREQGFLSQNNGQSKQLLNPLYDEPIKTTEGQCGYNVEKAMDVLLDLSALSNERSMNDDDDDDFTFKGDRRFITEHTDNFTDRASDCTSYSSESDLYDSIWSTGYNYRNNSKVLIGSEVPSPLKASDQSDLPQKVLESLFNISKSPQHEPTTMNWRNVVKKLQALGPRFDVSHSSSTEHQQELCAKGDEYQVFRKDAKQHWNSTKSCYQKASAAYSKGEWGYAAHLSEQGKSLTKLAQKADEKASHDIFKARNKSFENVITIDLHGQHVKPAMKLLKLHLVMVSYAQSVQTLRVITGCGSHGVGKSKLKQSVIELVENEGLHWSEENRGTVLIKLDGFREFSFLDTDSDYE